MRVLADFSAPPAADFWNHTGLRRYPKYAMVCLLRLPPCSSSVAFSCSQIFLAFVLHHMVLEYPSSTAGDGFR